MNLPKAIEILEELQIDLSHSSQLDRREATKLGIEALKRHQALQELYPVFNEPPLPGETKE